MIYQLAARLRRDSVLGRVGMSSSALCVHYPPWLSAALPAQLQGMFRVHVCLVELSFCRCPILGPEFAASGAIPGRDSLHWDQAELDVLSHMQRPRGP